MLSADHLPSDSPPQPPDAPPVAPPPPGRRDEGPGKDHPLRPTPDEVREPPAPPRPPISDPGAPPAQHA